MSVPGTLRAEICFLMWATVMFIYFFRYKEHKLAGETADTDDE